LKKHIKPAFIKIRSRQQVNRQQVNYERANRIERPLVDFKLGPEDSEQDDLLSPLPMSDGACAYGLALRRPTSSVGRRPFYINDGGHLIK